MKRLILFNDNTVSHFPIELTTLRTTFIGWGRKPTHFWSNGSWTPRPDYRNGRWIEITTIP